jgi:hypothetical protein
MIALALLVSAACVADEMLIEMETPDARCPDDGSFAESTAESAASRRRTSSMKPSAIIASTRRLIRWWSIGRGQSST